MKTIGVLGGLGPQATMDFEARVHRVAQRLIPQDGNQGYPPLVVCYFRQPPVILPADESLPTALPRQRAISSPDPKAFLATTRTRPSRLVRTSKFVDRSHCLGTRPMMGQTIRRRCAQPFCFKVDPGF